MLHDPDRHEALLPLQWDEPRVRRAIEQIAADAVACFSSERYWPLHPLDVESEADRQRIATPLYFGAAGMFWALRYLRDVGAVAPGRDPPFDWQRLLQRSREWLASCGSDDFASYLMGDTPVLLMAYGDEPSTETADRLAALIEGNVDHPARELMWGAPGTMLAALWLHQRSGDARWAELFRASAARLWSQRQWSDEIGCHYWTQDLYGSRSSYLDAVHGLAATASVLIRGRGLLPPPAWADWQRCITRTLQRTASREGDRASWRTQASPVHEAKKLMQFCHGAPGFVVCLADMPGAELDELLLAAGRAVWAAGPLKKGSNLCHGSAGNGYAFLKLYRRSDDEQWLRRARAFAMHAIAQCEAATALHRQARHSLWSGDIGLAIYLWHCLQGSADFPTLDVFYGRAG